MDKKEVIKLIQDEVKKQVTEANQDFIRWKVTDTPTDAFSMVNRGYSNMNGPVANRPQSSVATIGQRYFATDTSIPMTWSAGGWRNGVGSVVALAN